MFQEKEGWDRSVYGMRFWHSGNTAVVRVNGHPGGQPARPRVFLYPCVVGNSGSYSVSRGNSPPRKARKGRYHSRMHLHLHLHLQLHLRLRPCLHLLRVFPTVAAMYPPIARLRSCSEERDRQVPARGRCKTRKARQGRAGQGKYTMCMTQPAAVHTDSSDCPSGRSSCS